MPGTPTSVTSCGAPLADDAGERLAQERQLLLAADERRAPPTRSTPTRARARSAFQTGTGEDLPLASTARASLELDRPLGRSIGRLVDEDRARRRGRLETCRGVHDVARRHAFARLGPRVQRDERLAGRDPDPDLEVAFLGQRLPDRQRGAHGSLRVVLVRDRGAEHRHDGVADELLDGAAEALELGAHARVVGLEQPPHVLGIHRSARAVKPTRSQKRQVTTLRSSRGGASASSDVAHHEQKRASSAFSRPQLGQIFTRGG